MQVGPFRWGTGDETIDDETEANYEAGPSEGFVIWNRVLDVAERVIDQLRDQRTSGADDTDVQSEQPSD